MGNAACDKNQAASALRLLKKYQPETREAKKNRLMEMAQQKKDGQEVKTKKPQVIKYGLNHVTTLIENKSAKLVVIAHDVDRLSSCAGCQPFAAKRMCHIASLR